MKKMKRAVALLLAVSVLVTMGTTVSFAAGSRTYSEKTTTVSTTDGTEYSAGSSSKSSKKLYWTRSYCQKLKKRQGSSAWRVDKTGYKYTFKFYKKVNGKWSLYATRSGQKFYAGDPQSQFDRATFPNLFSDAKKKIKSGWFNDGEIYKWPWFYN